MKLFIIISILFSTSVNCQIKKIEYSNTYNSNTSNTFFSEPSDSRYHTVITIDNTNKIFKVENKNQNLVFKLTRMETHFSDDHRIKWYTFYDESTERTVKLQIQQARADLWFFEKGKGYGGLIGDYYFFFPDKSW
jgi:hypothetical protein